MIFNLLFLGWHGGTTVSGQLLLSDTAVHVNWIWGKIIYTVLPFFDCGNVVWNKYYYILKSLQFLSCPMSSFTLDMLATSFQPLKGVARVL